METRTYDEATIRRYLLGQLPNHDSLELELWLMTDDDALELVNAAEDDLIDESLAGRLKGNELRQFESHFLAAPERQKKYQFSKTLHRRLPDFNSGSKVAEKPARESIWTVIRSWFQYRIEVGYAVAAIAVVLTLGVLYQQTKLVSLEQQRDGLQIALNDTKNSRDAQIAANSNPGQQQEVTLVATPITRSQGTLKLIQIKSDSDQINFYVNLLDGESTQYRAELFAVGGGDTPIKTWNPVSIIRDGDHQRAHVVISAANLPNGEKTLVITPITNSPDPVSLSSRFVVGR